MAPHHNVAGALSFHLHPATIPVISPDKNFPAVENFTTSTPKEALSEMEAVDQTAFAPGADKTRQGKVFSRWNHLFVSAQYSPREFYSAVEALIQQHQVPELKISRVTWKERSLFSARREYLRLERGRYVYDLCAAPFGADFFFSSWLVILPPSFTFLQILGMLFTIVALLAVYCLHGLVWLGVAVAAFVLLALLLRGHRLEIFALGRVPLENFLLGLTIIGAIWERYFRRLTYFELDTAAMFQKAVHEAMLEVIDGITQAKGLRPMTKRQRRPILPLHVKLKIE